MSYMNRVQLSFDLFLQNYTLCSLGSTVLFGLAIIFALSSSASRKVSTRFQQWLLPGAATTGGGGVEHQSLDVPVAKSNIPKIFALIIGIDSYPSLSVLKGAVNDANDMDTYLKSDLGAPPGQVVNLRDEQATRKRIIEEIQALSNNPKIERGDPILIYYAGHGDLTKASDEWKERHGADQIQVIYPFDYKLKDPGSAGTEVNCIPDKTISTLLNELASKKGDNITVIFDACHASGIHANDLGQKDIGEDRRERDANVKLEILPGLDDDLFAPDDLKLYAPETKLRGAGPMLCTDQTSHVYLAACGISQKATEVNGRGVFTTALLKKIRESRVDNITYHNLLKSLDISSYGQSPQCYGKHQSRILFNSHVSPRSKPLVPVEYDGRVFTLEAGEASGVTLGSTWELHEAPTEDSSSAGQFTVIELYGSLAILKPIGAINKARKGDHQLYGRCIRVGPGNELKVWMSPDDRKLVFQNREHKGGAHEDGIGYVMTPTRNIADITLEVQRSHSPAVSGTAELDVAFYWRDSITTKYGVEQLKHRKPARREEVKTVLFAAARWKWHLQRHSQGRQQDAVTIRAVKVASRVECYHGCTSEPVPVPTNTDGLAEMVADNMTLYGVKLTSRISQPIYVRAFYFDATDFAIEDMFGRNVAQGENTPNIGVRGQLLIGDGGNGRTPFAFNISPGNRVEVGYMKVFWSTEPLELDDMVQIPAFKLRSRIFRPEALGFKKAAVLGNQNDVRWGSTCLAILLRAPLKKYTISRSMSNDEIAAILTDRGCQDLSKELDPHSFGNHPVCRGGLGDIYKGELKDKKVALKTTRLYTINNDKSYLRHVAKELDTWSKCRHPNVLNLLGLASFRGQIGMVCEWMMNGNVQNYLDVRPGADRCQLCFGIAEGLAYLHGLKIIHGDLKGANILISDDGTPMLADFGNAVLLEHSLEFTAPSVTGAKMSIRWAAPEILNGSISCSYPADVYGLGMTWLEVISGEVPFHEIKREIALFHQVINEKKAPTRPDAQIPSDSKDGDALWALLLNCWNYSPTERPSAQKARDLVKTITTSGLARVGA